MPAPDTKQMKLVWSDEFDKQGLPDPKKWDYEVGKLRNRELQYYTRERLENVHVRDGKLHIVARKEQFRDADITSASLTTHGRFEFTYGYVEVRAKVPGGRGTWPAVWMLGSNVAAVGWPKCGEIDIMEYVGWDADRFHFTIHCAAKNHTKNNGPGKPVVVKGAADDFHTFGMHWTRDAIDFYLDGQAVHHYGNDGGGVDTWPFTGPQYLLVNLAIGGTWGGQKGVDDAIFPATFSIDYVRVYQEK